MSNMNLDDTIVAVSTPIGEGGIGIVRLSGSGALEISDKIFKPSGSGKPSEFKTYTTHYGHIVNISKSCANHQTPTTDHNIIDEVILTVMRSPGSYTKEDIVEINCHGGLQAIKKVLELVLECGARLAEPGEFTKRAFLNGRIDLAQAEAVLDVIRAKTEGALRIAVGQLEGGLSKKVNDMREEILDILSHVEASIDFPEEDIEIIKEKNVVKKIDAALKGLQDLIETYKGGIVMREGVLMAICGKPNAGKSSLMNLLLKRDRVIVSPVPGTTRDAIEETINIRGIPIRIVDTAGIGRTKDLLGREGVRRSKKYLELADIVLLMLDASSEIQATDREIIKLIGNKKKIIVVNKIDLKKKINIKDVRRLFKREMIVEISIKTKKNIKRLEKSVSDTVWKGKFNQAEGAIVSNARHKELLDRALENMLSVKKALKGGLSGELLTIDLKEAVFNLGLLIGKSVSDDILNRIFDQFCIGK